MARRGSSRPSEREWDFAMPRLTSGALVIVAVSLLAAAGGVLLQWDWTGHADPDDAAQVAVGQKVYATHCAACHGANLEGQPEWRIRKPDGRLPAPPHDEGGHTWHHPDEQLFQITKLGLNPPLAPAGYESDMPAFGSVLSDEEIWAVLAFIKSRWPPHIRTRQLQRNERATQR